MRLRSALREAVLNVGSGTTRAILCSVVFAVVIALLAIADIVAVADTERQAARFQSSGGSTLIYRLPSAIDADACDGLRRLPGVKASGAVRHRDAGVTSETLPNQQIPAYDISPGFSGFTALGRPSPSGGVLVSEDAARTLGVAVGQHLSLDGGEPRVGDVFTYAADGRRPGFGYAVLLPVDTGSAFDECWVEGWPASDELLGVLPTLLVPGAAADEATSGPQLAQLNATHGARFDGRSMFENRPTRFVPAVGAASAMGLGFAVTMRRRLELAGARHAGVPPMIQVVQLSVETLTWAFGGCVLAFPILVAGVLAQASTDPSSLAALALRTALAAVPAAVLGATAATLSIRERQLFAYFKAR